MKMKSFRMFITIVCAIFLLAGFLLPDMVYTGQDPLQKLKGPPFSDSSKIYDMPKGWEKQPIKYDDSVKGADIAITLDQHLYHSLLPVIKAYARENSLKIALDEGTCGVSAGKLNLKQVDMAGFCCPPGESDRLPGLRYHTLGIASLAFFVHPSNPVGNVTFEQLRMMYQGEIENWSELRTPDGRKGPDLPIQPIGRLHCKVRAGHWRLLFDNEDMFSPTMMEGSTIPDIITLIADNRGSIGWAVLWSAVRYEDKERLKALKIDGLSPYDNAALASNTYPTYRTFNITTWEGGLANPHVAGLVERLRKEIGNIDKKFGIVTASELKESGWKFRENEIIGEPEKN